MSVGRKRRADSGTQASPSQAPDWFPDPLPALIRARASAVELARRTNTAIVEAKKDGLPFWVCPGHSADDGSGPLCSVCGGERLPR
jgi:hypothetical protein